MLAVLVVGVHLPHLPFVSAVWVSADAARGLACFVVGLTVPDLLASLGSRFLPWAQVSATCRRISGSRVRHTVSARYLVGRGGIPLEPG